MDFSAMAFASMCEQSTESSSIIPKQIMDSVITDPVASDGSSSITTSIGPSMTVIGPLTTRIGSPTPAFLPTTLDTTATSFTMNCSQTPDPRDPASATSDGSSSITAKMSSPVPNFPSTPTDTMASPLSIFHSIAESPIPVSATSGAPSRMMAAMGPSVTTFPSSHLDTKTSSSATSIQMPDPPAPASVPSGESPILAPTIDPSAPASLSTPRRNAVCSSMDSKQIPDPPAPASIPSDGSSRTTNVTGPQLQSHASNLRNPRVSAPQPLTPKRRMSFDGTTYSNDAYGTGWGDFLSKEVHNSSVCSKGCYTILHTSKTSQSPFGDTLFQPLTSTFEKCDEYQAEATRAYLEAEENRVKSEAKIKTLQESLEGRDDALKESFKMLDAVNDWLNLEKKIKSAAFEELKSLYVSLGKDNFPPEGLKKHWPFISTRDAIENERLRKRWQFNGTIISCAALLDGLEEDQAKPTSDGKEYHCARYSVELTKPVRDFIDKNRTAINASIKYTKGYLSEREEFIKGERKKLCDTMRINPALVERHRDLIMCILKYPIIKSGSKIAKTVWSLKAVLSARILQEHQPSYAYHLIKQHAVPPRNILAPQWDKAHKMVWEEYRAPLAQWLVHGKPKGYGSMEDYWWWRNQKKEVQNKASLLVKDMTSTGQTNRSSSASQLASTQTPPITPKAKKVTTSDGHRSVERKTEADTAVGKSDSVAPLVTSNQSFGKLVKSPAATIKSKPIGIDSDESKTVADTAVSKSDSVAPLVISNQSLDKVARAPASTIVSNPIGMDFEDWVKQTKKRLPSLENELVNEVNPAKKRRQSLGSIGSKNKINQEKKGWPSLDSSESAIEGNQNNVRSLPLKSTESTIEVDRAKKRRLSLDSKLANDVSKTKKRRLSLGSMELTNKVKQANKRRLSLGSIESTIEVSPAKKRRLAVVSIGSMNEDNQAKRRLSLDSKLVNDVGKAKKMRIAGPEEQAGADNQGHSAINNGLPRAVAPVAVSLDNPSPVDTVQTTTQIPVPQAQSSAPEVLSESDASSDDEFGDLQTAILASIQESRPTVSAGTPDDFQTAILASIQESRPTISAGTPDDLQTAILNSLLDSTPAVSAGKLEDDQNAKPVNVHDDLPNDMLDNIPAILPGTPGDSAPRTQDLPTPPQSPGEDGHPVPPKSYPFPDKSPSSEHVLATSYVSELATLDASFLETKQQERIAGHSQGDESSEDPEKSASTAAEPLEHAQESPSNEESGKSLQESVSVLVDTSEAETCGNDESNNNAAGTEKPVQQIIDVSAKLTQGNKSSQDLDKPTTTAVEPAEQAQESLSKEEFGKSLQESVSVLVETSEAKPCGNDKSGNTAAVTEKPVQQIIDVPAKVTKQQTPPPKKLPSDDWKTQDAIFWGLQKPQASTTTSTPAPKTPPNPTQLKKNAAKKEQTKAEKQEKKEKKAAEKEKILAAKKEADKRAGEIRQREEGDRAELQQYFKFYGKFQIPPEATWLDDEWEYPDFRKVKKSGD